MAELISLNVLHMMENPFSDPMAPTLEMKPDPWWIDRTRNGLHHQASDGYLRILVPVNPLQPKKIRFEAQWPKMSWMDPDVMFTVRTRTEVKANYVVDQRNQGNIQTDEFTFDETAIFEAIPSGTKRPDDPENKKRYRVFLGDISIHLADVATVPTPDPVPGPDPTPDPTPDPMPEPDDDLFNDVQDLKRRMSSLELTVSGLVSKISNYDDLLAIRKHLIILGKSIEEETTNPPSITTIDQPNPPNQ